MSSCSSCTPASQQVIQQLYQKAEKPVQTDPAKPADTQQDALNTSGDRGTSLNVKT